MVLGDRCVKKANFAIFSIPWGPSNAAGLHEYTAPGVMAGALRGRTWTWLYSGDMLKEYKSVFLACKHGEKDTSRTGMVECSHSHRSSSMDSV